MLSAGSFEALKKCLLSLERLLVECSVFSNTWNPIQQDWRVWVLSSQSQSGVNTLAELLQSRVKKIVEGTRSVTHLLNWSTPTHQAKAPERYKLSAPAQPANAALKSKPVASKPKPVAPAPVKLCTLCKLHVLTSEFDSWSSICKTCNRSNSRRSGTGRKRTLHSLDSSRLTDAISQGDFDAAEALLSSGLQPGSSDMHAALGASVIKTRFLELLLKHGGDVNAKEGDRQGGLTLLLSAAQQGYIAPMELLVASKANLLSTFTKSRG